MNNASDPFFENVKQLFTVEQHMFSRRGAWLALQATSAKYGRGALYLMTNHGSRCHSGNKEYSRLYRLYPTFEGRCVPFAIETAAAEYTLHTRHGDVRFTWADTTKLIAQGDKNMGLFVERNAEPFEVLKPRKDGAWESPIRGNPLLFKGLEGSAITFDDTYNFHKFMCPEIRGRTHPNSDGIFTLVIEDFPYCVWVRDKYPSYEEAKASMQADWDEFLAKFPHFTEPYEQKREETAYILWSHLVAPTVRTPTWMIMMFPGVIGSQWQHVKNAVALQDHTDLSLDLLLAYLYAQDPEKGQLPESYDDDILSTHSIKPPIFGWALKDIMSRRDITKVWPRDKIEFLYEGAGRWANWFMECRDDDGDGLPLFSGGEENGLDESTIWADQINMVSPDLSSYLVLSFEAQGDLAKILGKPKEEVEAWYKKSKDLLELMIEKMWDGEHFVALREYTHEPVFTGTLTHYIPFILGNRLPPEIIDKMAADLSVEGGLVSKYGLATERMDSDFFEVQDLQMGCGAIDPPAEVFIITGMWEAGKKDLARDLVSRYCGRLMDRGFSHIIDPISGDGSPFWGTWSRCVFTILCRMVSEG
ncbi:MAG: hypothetical protein GXX89_00335 [Clostridiales bacterium]|nr:hypothetical protein [Clostridiales bacterium]